MRPVFRLPITHKLAKKLFRHRPLHGTICAAADRFSECGNLCVRKNQILSKSGFVSYNLQKCYATDLLGFLKYGKWVRYDPIDGDYSNLRWSNLKRVRAPNKPKVIPT